MTEMRSGATISPDGIYRYALWREWGEHGRGAPAPNMTFIMLNPSTADHEVDDATIRRCIGFAKREGCTGITVVNLYALRATRPAKLLAHPDPIGPDNQRTVRDVLYASGQIGWPVVAAWGAWDGNIDRLDIAAIAEQFRVDLLCLGKTKSGAPRHPLYLKTDAPLVSWP